MPSLSFPKILKPYHNTLGYICTTTPSHFQLPANVNIAFCKQIHQNIVFEAQQNILFHEEADAIITQEKNIALSIRTADCLSIIVFDPKKKAIGNIHAGWRGQSMKIVTKTLELFCQKYNSQSEDIVIVTSPSLGECCAEFSSPYTELPLWMHPFIKKNKVNLKEALLYELLSFSIQKKNIEISPICSCCNSQKWHSYRRNKTEQRIINTIWLKS